MKPFDQYRKLSDFITDLEQSTNLHFPLKVMGQKRPQTKKQSAVYYSASMLAEVYRSIPDPDASGTKIPIQAAFGEIFNRGCNLNQGASTYSQIIPHKNGHNLFQGDILNFDLNLGDSRIPDHRLSMILTHSCGITNSELVCLAPVYLESELDQNAVEFLKAQSTPNFALVRGNWLRNENSNYLGLPPIDLFSGEGDKLLVCLNLAETIPKKAIPSQPLLRLTYRALSYLQARVALFFLRDVQDSDETRDF